MTAELYTRLAAVSGISAVFDTKLPDDYVLAGTIAVVTFISDEPMDTIASLIAGREQRMQVEIQALDLALARTAKEALITSMHGWAGSVVRSCLYESCGPELYDGLMVPARYCLPVDFMIEF